MKAAWKSRNALKCDLNIFGSVWSPAKVVTSGWSLNLCSRGTEILFLVVSWWFLLESYWEKKVIRIKHAFSINFIDCFNKVVSFILLHHSLLFQPIYDKYIKTKLNRKVTFYIKLQRLCTTKRSFQKMKECENVTILWKYEAALSAVTK